MKICIDDGSTNIKLAWTENGKRRNAISPNSFKSEWSAPFGGTQPANYMLDGVRYGFDPVSDRFVQTTDTQYQYSDVNVIAIHHALVKSGITPQEVDVVVTLPLSEYFDTNAHRLHHRHQFVDRKHSGRLLHITKRTLPAGHCAHQLWWYTVSGQHIITGGRLDVHELIPGGDLLEWQDLHTVLPAVRCLE